MCKSASKLEKKTFSQGVLIPHKMRNCNDCKKDILCESCDKLVN